MRLYGYLADLVVGVHVVYVGFVVLGLLAILAGMLFRWQWVRNRWFRCLHLLAIVIVAGEAILNITCPLTRWEADLRTAAGQAAAAGTFMGRLLDRVLFYSAPEWVFACGYIGFALLVLSTFWFAPVRWRPALPQRPACDPAAGVS
jgi:hypothetical protein